MSIKREIQASVVLPKELSDDDKVLLEKAIEVRLNAHAPYSNFFVGAAVLSARGNVYVGCNVERGTLTQTTHAEQNAIDTMMANEGSEACVLAVATVGAFKDEKPSLDPEYILENGGKHDQISPSCGHCLQIIWEHSVGNDKVVLLQFLLHGLIAKTTIGDALPMRYSFSEK